MTVIPALAMFYVGRISSGEMALPTQVTAFTLLGLCAVIAFGGYRMIRKYARSITAMQKCLNGIASGVLPEKLKLYNARESDELKQIEQGINSFLGKMRNELDHVNRNYELEHHLLQKMTQHHRAHLEAAHSAIDANIFTVCSHLIKPAEKLHVGLEAIRHRMKSEADVPELTYSFHELDEIRSTLKRILSNEEIVVLEGESGVKSRAA